MAKIEDRFPVSKLFVIVCFFIVGIGTIADALYSGGFPIFNNIPYNSFGVPTLHAIVMVLSPVAAMYVMQLSCLRGVNIARILLIIYFIMPGILSFSRSSLLLISIDLFFIFLYTKFKKWNFKTIKYSIVLGILAMYLFGISGNIRLNKQVGVETGNVFDSSLIYVIGGESGKINSDSLVSPLFWPYVYLTSPTANMQSAINNKVTMKGESFDIKKLIITEYMPITLGNAFYPDYKEELSNYGYTTRVNPLLNVSTTFYGSYLQFGWIGMLFMAVFILMFPAVYLYILCKINSSFFIMGISVINTMYLLAAFDNPWSFAGTSLELLLILIFSIVFKNNSRMKGEGNINE